MPPTLKWETPEYEFFDKDPSWFRHVLVATILLVILSLLFRDVLLAIILLIGGFAVMLYGARLPEIIEVALTAKGVHIKEDLYPYHNLRSFWISDDHGEDRPLKLILEADRFFLPHLVIPLAPETNPEVVRSFLRQYLKEERHEESLADLLFDLIHF